MSGQLSMENVLQENVLQEVENFHQLHFDGSKSESLAHWPHTYSTFWDFIFPLFSSLVNSSQKYRHHTSTLPNPDISWTKVWHPQPSGKCLEVANLLVLKTV